MSRSFHAALGCLLLTVIWTGCSADQSTAARESAAPRNANPTQARKESHAAVHEPTGQWPEFAAANPPPTNPPPAFSTPANPSPPIPPWPAVPTAPAPATPVPPLPPFPSVIPAQPETPAVEPPPAFTPVEPPPATTPPALAPVEPQQPSAAHTTRRPQDLFPIEDFKNSLLPPKSPANTGRARPIPADEDSQEPEPFSLAKAHPQLTADPHYGPNELRPARIPTGGLQSTTSENLPPIRSRESMPRKGSPSSARVAIADSSRGSANLPKEPSGGSAPVRPSQRQRRVPMRPEMTLRMDTGSDAPPLPNLAEAPPPRSPAEGPTPADGSPSPVVPEATPTPSPIPRETVVTNPELPPALRNPDPPAPNTAITPLFTSAAQRMKGDHEQVEVFFGTDRYPDNANGENPRLVLLRFSPALGLVILTTLLLGMTLYRSCRWRWWLATGLSGSVAFGLIFYAASITSYNSRELAKQGPRYGVERGELQTGICQISIPRVHQVGNLEAPSIIKLEVSEDLRKHLVLQQVSQLPPNDFYRKLQQRVANSERRELFIFIHGYNVSFEDAARRTAQMHYDLDYQGAPVFYSWPSQGELWKYTVDETNVAYTAPHFKQFVRDIATYSGAKSINLIAHSMGNRVMTSALRDIALEMDDQPKLFNQVVLAAPDIDAEVFKQDIAPLITKTATNVTLYASSHDQALLASKLVHGYPRAGESGQNLVVLPGIDTIDVSSVETNFLGHNYYGDSDVILADICRLLTGEQNAPKDRQWLTPTPTSGQLTYWVFQSARAAACMPRTRR